MLVRGSSLWARTRSTLKHQGNRVLNGEGACQRLPKSQSRVGVFLVLLNPRAEAKLIREALAEGLMSPRVAGGSAQCQTAVRAEPDL